MSNLHFGGILKGPENIIVAASPQNFTASWALLGTPAEYYVQGARKLALFLSLDINGSTDLRIRALARMAAAGASYTLPIATVGSSVVEIEDEYLEFTDDADQLIVLSWDLEGLVPYVRFEIIAGTLGGGTAAQVDLADLYTAQ